MPYIRYLTIKSFGRLNPDWKIVFLYPKVSVLQTTWFGYENKQLGVDCVDFLPEVMKLNIDKVEIDMSMFGLDNNISEVHKSDFIRWYYLGEYGGVWSDMDIIYTKPMNDIYFNKKENEDRDSFLCICDYGHSIGFMMSSPHNSLFRFLSEESKKNFNPSFYQTIGATLINQNFRTIESVNTIVNGYNFDRYVVYPYLAGEETNFFHRTRLTIPERTVGFHWFAGHPMWRNFILRTNGGLRPVQNTIIEQIINNERNC